MLTDPSEEADNSTQVGDGGTYTPNSSESGSTDACEKDEDGNCVDEAVNTASANLSTTDIDFGESELGAVECQDVSVTAGVSFSAEIDKNNTDVVDGAYQFVFKDINGNYTEERIEGEGTLTICYKRDATDSHSGQIKVILNSGGSGSVYAALISVKGTTGAVLFTITSPTEGLTIDSRAGHYEDIDTEEGEYKIFATGSVNLDFVSIFESGMTTPVYIDADGVKYKTTLTESGSFNEEIGVSTTPGWYNVSFSLNTNKGTTLTKTIAVVVGSSPTLEIEVRDSAGALIDTASYEELNSISPTDAASIIIGFKIANLEVAGVAAGDLAVDLTGMTFNDKEIADDISDLVYDAETSLCHDDDGKDYEGFDAATTFCVPLRTITELNPGVNAISATVTNELGTTTQPAYLILDNNKPVINITSPGENELYESETYSITIAGTVKNFAPVAVNTTAPSAVGDDTGSYCQASSEASSSCPESAIKLWVNTAKDDANYPIYIYPKLDESYSEKTLAEANDEIAGDDDDRGNCHTESETETLFDGTTGTTTVDSSGNIVTTVTDASGNVTQTYTTSASGTITAEATGDDEEAVVAFTDDDNITNTATTDATTGDITLETFDADKDTTTTTTVDAETGTITQTTKQTACNIPSGEFSITLTFPESSKHHGKINLYSNILEFEVESVSGHRTIAVRTFAEGYNRNNSREYGENSRSSTLWSSLGIIDDTCGFEEDVCVNEAPVMLNISEGVLNRSAPEGLKVVKLVESLLNDNFKFSSLANGWPHPTNEDGDVDLLKTFREHYIAETGEDFDWIYDLDTDYWKEAIWSGIHSNSMAQKYLALQIYRQYRMSANDKNTPECSVDRVENCYMETIGDQFDLDTGFAVAHDACDNPITEAFLPLSDIQHYRRASSGVTSTIPFEGEWPAIAGPDINFNDFVEGKWHVDKLELKQGGYVDAEACLVPADIEVENCSDDVSNAQTPAFWGHMVSYALIKGGILQGAGIDDDTIPLIWSVGKVRLKLTDIIQVKNKTLGGYEADCQGVRVDTSKYEGTWTNMVDICLSPNVPEAVTVDVTNDTYNDNTVIIEPFANCDTYYKNEYNTYRQKIIDEYDIEIPEYSREDHLPFGCNPDGKYYPEFANYPMTLERTSSQGQYLYNIHHDDGNTTFLIALIWQGVADTFKKIIGCMDTEIANPIINSDAYPYPPWVYDDAKLSLDFEWEDFRGLVNINQSDLNLYESGLTLRLPLKLGVDGVSPANAQTKISGVTPALLSTGSTEKSNYTKAALNGHLARTDGKTKLNGYPLTSDNPDSAVYLSASINIEEIANSALHLLFKKGPGSLLDSFDFDDIEKNNNWSFGVDKVVLNRMDICEVAGLMGSELPVDQLFATVQSQFDQSALHLDIILDPTRSPTISLNPIIDGDAVVENAVEVQVAISNLQLGVKELIPSMDGSGNIINNVYDDPKTQSEILRVRVDGVLSLYAIYHQSEAKINLFIPEFAKQNLHLSVVNGGTTYDDANVVSDLMTTVLPPTFAFFAKDFDSAPTATPSASVELVNDEGSISVAELANLKVTFNSSSQANASCNGDVALYKDEWDSNGNGLPDKLENALNNQGPDLPLMPIDEDTDTGTDKPDVIDNIKNLVATQSKIGSIMQDSCYYKSHTMTRNEDGTYTREDNALEEALCDFGIDDIWLKASSVTTPLLIFDTQHGYIHVASDLCLDLENEQGCDSL